MSGRTDLRGDFEAFRGAWRRLGYLSEPGQMPATYLLVLARYPEGTCPPPPQTEYVTPPASTTTGTTTTTTTVPTSGGPTPVLQLCGGDIVSYRAIFGNSRQAPTDLKNYCDRYIEVLERYRHALVQWRLFNGAISSFVSVGAAKDNKEKDKGAVYRTEDGPNKYTSKPSFDGQIGFISRASLFKPGSHTVFAKTAEELKNQFVNLARDNKEEYVALLERNQDNAHSAEIAAAKKRSQANHVRTIAVRFEQASQYLPD